MYSYTLPFLPDLKLYWSLLWQLQRRLWHGQERLYRGIRRGTCKAIQTYWKKQDGDTVERWTKTAEALEGLSEKVKRYAGDNNSSFAGFCF